MPVSSSHPLLSAAKEAAWNGDQERAIALSSEALYEPDLDPGTVLDLYDTRAESYIAQGRLELAQQDAAAMMAVAQESGEPEYESQQKKMYSSVDHSVKKLRHRLALILVVAALAFAAIIAINVK